MIKRLLKSILAKAGFQISRIPARFIWGQDPFADQLRLMPEHKTRTIFDVGANVGQTADRYLTLFPKADIYCFEPFPQAFSTLAAKFANVSRVKPHCLAIANRTGTSCLFTNVDPLTNSLFPSAGKSHVSEENGKSGPRNVIDITTGTLDDFCTKQGLSNIDVLKLDIQGGELLALRGAEELLTRKSVKLIYLELLFARLYEGQANHYEICELLSRYGYSQFGLYNVVQGTREGLMWADAIFLSPQLFSA